MASIVAGDVPTLNQNTTGSAATLTTGRTIAITGDLAYTSGTFNGSANVTGTGTLATVNANVGSFTNASLTVNAKGLITAASSGTAPVTSVTGTSPVVSSGGATPAISLAAAYGDTLNPYASKTANTFLAAPNGAAGVPSFRAVVAADIPTLNQNTTGSAATLTTARTINEVSFNGSANITIPRVKSIDDRATAPADASAAYATFGFGSWANNSSAPYADNWIMRSYTDSSGGNDNMLSFRKDALGMRLWQQTWGSATNFATFKDVCWTDGTNASGSWGINVTGSSGSCTGNAATATNLTSTNTSWVGNGVISAVVGQLSWKNYGNNHTIFDASASTSPAGGAVNNTNAAVAWSATYPTLMGWNGASTYGVRVDSARVSDNGMPSGGIIIWSGSSASIPSGWLLCNGTSGTPDLRDRFIVGAGSTYAVGATGGSANAVLVSHTHTATSTVTDPGHFHDLPGNTSSGSIRQTQIGVNATSVLATSASKTTGITVGTTNSTEGVSATNANLPPYYALCYIMKS